MKNNILKKFAKRLVQIRKDNEMTQEELSRKTKISRSTIAMLETSKRDITLTKIEKIAKALNVEIKELLNF